MSFHVHIRPEAEWEIQEAAQWYETQKQGLGRDFLDEVLAIVDILSREPKRYPVIYRNTRRALIHRFPFGVHFFIDAQSVIIIAVMHGSRDPKGWRKRV